VVTRPKFTRTQEIVGIIYGGVRVDGKGGIIINGVPHPIDPWGPLVARPISSAIVAAGAKALDKKLGTQVSQIAAKDALSAIKGATTAFEKEAGL
jgi:hypothetical protein